MAILSYRARDLRFRPRRDGLETAYYIIVIIVIIIISCSWSIKRSSGLEACEVIQWGRVQ